MSRESTWKNRIFLGAMGILLLFAAPNAVLAADVQPDTSWYASEQSEYTIDSAADLKGLAQIVNGTAADIEKDNMSGKTVTLGAELDMNGVTMEPIGNSSSAKFQGTFDGNGKKIKNLTLAYTETYARAGLFGYINGATIRDLIVDTGTSITAAGASTYAGGIVGDAAGSTVSGCSFNGTVESQKSYAGGIVGYMNNKTMVVACTNTGTVKCSATSGSSVGAGGIVGYAYNGTVSCCTNTGSITSDKANAGGIAGYGAANGYVQYCVNTGTVTSADHTTGGGIGGANVNIDSCFTTTDKVYGTNSTRYTCANAYCKAEGESALSGVTYYADADLTNGELLKKLNEGGGSVWRTGTEHPEVNRASVLGMYMTIGEEARQYPAEYDKNTKTFTMEVPYDAELDKLAAANFHATPLVDGAVLEYVKDADGNGAKWTLNVSYGSDAGDKETYKLQVSPIQEPWTPEISTDLNDKKIDAYYTGNLDNVTALTVEAKIYDKGNLSYQWYENTTNSTENATKIEGATLSTYTPVVEKNGKPDFSTKYYYVVITNTLHIGDADKTASVTSKLHQVKVQYTVTYTDKNYSKNNRTERVDFGGKPAPKILTEAGQNFLGWCKSEQYAENEKWTDESGLTDDLTLYACWEAIHYTITLPESTKDYTVTPADASVKDVLYDGEYSFTVTPKKSGAFVLVKANGVRIKGADNLYKITDIHENQNVTVEYTEGVSPDEDGAYSVKNEAELLSVLESAGDALTVKLTGDISITSGTMNPTQAEAFEGTLDGQGHSVTGLNGPLFGWIGEKGVVKNLNASGTLDNYDKRIHYGESVNTGGGGIDMTCPDFLGSIAAVSYGTITKCTSDATLDSTDFPTGDGWGTNDNVGLGGLVGVNFGTIEYCGFSGEIMSGFDKNMNMGGDSYGGIASSNDGVIRYCYNVGAVQGSAAGGIAGRMNDYNETMKAVVEHCYSAGTVDHAGSSVGGQIVGYTNYFYREEKEPVGLINNYFQKPSRNGVGYDCGNNGSDESRAAGMTEDQMKSLEVIAGLNKTNETSVFIKDLDNQNNGYPILTWQGTPKITAENVSFSFTGAAQAETEFSVSVDTELDYTLEWLVCDEDGFTVITKEDENGDPVPFAEPTLPVDGEYVGKNLKVRVISTQDGSSVVSDPQGPVLPAPIEQIYFEGFESEENPAADLILNELQADQNGTITLKVLTDPAASNSLLDKEKIVWSSSEDGIVEIEAGEAVYDSAKETPASAVISAAKAGATTVSATIGEYTASVDVTVHPAYVETKLRMGDDKAPQEVVAGAANLQEIYGAEFADAPQYVTPLHLLTAYVQEILEEDAAEYITIADGNVTAINGDAGEWICIVNGSPVGGINTSYEIRPDDTVVFYKKNDAVDKIASFDKDEYKQFSGMELTVTLQAVSIDGAEGEASALADAQIIVKKDGSAVENLSAKTDGSGKAVLTIPEAGSYELTAAHTDADGKNDIVAPYATVTVEQKIAVTDIQVSDTERTMEAGTTFSWEAAVQPENASIPELVFASDHDEIAEVTQEGIITAKQPGTANVTVTSRDNPEISKTIVITVVRLVNEIQLVQDSATVKVGESCQIEASALPGDATNQAFTYLSNRPSVAEVDETGKVTGKSVGETTIVVMATDGSDVRAEFTVTVVTNVVPVEKIMLNAKKVSMKEGQTWQITAMVSPENATNKQVVYTSSDSAVATVSSAGLVTAVKAGKTVVKVVAKDGSKASAELQVEVRAADSEKKPTVKLNAKSAPLQVKKSTKAVKILSSSILGEKIVSAISSNPKILSVKVKKGILTLKAGKKTGKAVVTVATESGGTAKITIRVQKKAVKTKKLSMSSKKVTLAPKKKWKLEVMRKPITGTEKITWSSSNGKVAKVNKKGVVTAVQKGSATITARTSNGKKAICKIRVK